MNGLYARLSEMSQMILQTHRSSARALRSARCNAAKKPGLGAMYATWARWQGNV